MKRIFFLILVLISNFAFSQSPSTIWAVPNNSASFTITMAKNSLCFQKDSAYLWRIDTIAASSRTLANTPKTLVGGGSSGGSYWTLSGNYLYPNNTTDSVGIGTTTPTAKLDVIGSFKLITDNGYNLVSGNPFGRTIYPDGSYFYKQVNGGYLYNGITELFKGDIRAGMCFTNDILTADSVKITRMELDEDEIYWRIIDYQDPTNKIFYSFDVNKCCGWDFQQYDNIGDSIFHIFSMSPYNLNGNTGSSILFDSEQYRFDIHNSRHSTLFLLLGGIKYVSPSRDTIFSADTNGNVYAGKNLINHTNIDSLLKINGAWYNRYDNLTISASADSSIFATKSYTLNNFKGSADSSVSSGFLTRHQAALSYAPISTVNYFSRTGKTIYPTLSTNKIMIGSTTMSDTITSGLLIRNGMIASVGSTGSHVSNFNGAGNKFFWIPALGSLIAGIYTGEKADQGSIGTSSIALGCDNQCHGSYSIAAGGSTNTVPDNYSGVIGGAVNSISTRFSFIGGGTNNTISTSAYSGIINGMAITNNNIYQLATGSYNVIPSASNTAYSYIPAFVVGNGTGTGANTNNALTLRRNGFLGLNVGDTSAYPRAFIQVNVKSNKYTNRNLFHFVDNVRNQKINTLTQVRDTSCYYGTYTTTGKLQLFVVDNNGVTTCLLDSTGEQTSKISHAFFNTPDTTYTPAVTQNAYTTLVFPKAKDVLNFTKTGDSLIIQKAGSYHVTFDWSMQGSMGEDYRMAIFVNGVLLTAKTQTTTGATNYQGQSLQAYIGGASVGDRITLRVTNLTNNNDCTLKEGSFYIRREY